jgi:hypothetical protein
MILQTSSTLPLRDRWTDDLNVHNLQSKFPHIWRTALDHLCSPDGTVTGSSIEHLVRFRRSLVKRERKHYAKSVFLQIGH